MFIRLDFQPGIDVERTSTTMRGGWVSSNLIRVREGKYEKHLGWQRLAPNPINGVARTCHFWSDLQGVPWLAIGTSEQLYVVNLQAITGLPAFTVSIITPTGWAGGSVNKVAGDATTPLIWCLDNFGQDLVCNPSGGALYFSIALRSRSTFVASWVSPGGRIWRAISRCPSIRARTET